MCEEHYNTHFKHFHTNIQQISNYERILNYKAQRATRLLTIESIIKYIQEASETINKRVLNKQSECIQRLIAKKEDYLKIIAKQQLDESDYDTFAHLITKHAIFDADCNVSEQKLHISEVFSTKPIVQNIKNQNNIKKELIFQLPKRNWEIITLILCICSFGFLVGALNHEHWFTQFYQFNDLKGSLLYPKDKANNWHYYFTNCNELFTGKGYCQQLEAFYFAGFFYALLDTIGSIFMVIISIIILANMFEINSITRILSIKTSRKLLYLVTILHCCAFIIWASIVGLKADDCKFSLPINIQHEVCAEDGANLAIWNMAFLIGFSIFYCFLSKKFERFKGNNLIKYL